MTQPRFVLRGDTVMITRPTLRRHHLFRPDSAIRQLYLYTLAVCAAQFGILVHAVTLMSTHEHLIVTDTKGRFPLFLRELHRLVSLGTKVLRKWEGPTWDAEQTSVVRLLTDQAIIEKLACVAPRAQPGWGCWLSYCSGLGGTDFRLFVSHRVRNFSKPSSPRRRGAKCSRQPDRASGDGV